MGNGVNHGLTATYIGFNAADQYVFDALLLQKLQQRCAPECAVGKLAQDDILCRIDWEPVIQFHPVFV